MSGSHAIVTCCHCRRVNLKTNGCLSTARGQRSCSAGVLWRGMAAAAAFLLLFSHARCARAQDAPPAPITLDQAIAIARAHNPALLSAEQNLLATRAQEVQAGVRENPYFTLYGSNLSNPATSSTPYAYSLQLSRLFERGQKRRWRLDSARHNGRDGCRESRPDSPDQSAGGAGLYRHAAGQGLPATGAG